MKRRHQRRATLAAFTVAGILAGLLSIASPASAIPRIAGVGLVSTGGTALNARSGPASAFIKTGAIAEGTYISIVCQVIGEHVDGRVKATRIWNRLPNNSYVSDAFISRPWFEIPVCDPKTVPRMPTTSWTLPVTAGLVSGFRTSSRPGHDGVDLGAARNTPIRAAASGTVIRVVCNVSTNNCNVDGNRTLSGCGWYAEILHVGNIVTRYCHMVRRPAVNVGQRVARGQVIGYVGSSGSSSGPHLHFEVHVHAPPATHANAVSPISFFRARGLVIR
ncbi:MAG TPA: peptidoglycan DD-metalloendopeptidase family protein [Actinoplanes sp.]|jgi:murein DD-endopeptidase MepM/ murein hydrolase activator NlpD